jgi:hypothetical protein
MGPPRVQEEPAQSPPDHGQPEPVLQITNLQQPACFPGPFYLLHIKALVSRALIFLYLLIHPTIDIWIILSSEIFHSYSPRDLSVQNIYGIDYYY